MRKPYAITYPSFSQPVLEMRKKETLYEYTLRNEALQGIENLNDDLLLDPEFDDISSHPLKIECLNAPY